MLYAIGKESLHPVIKPLMKAAIWGVAGASKGELLCP